MSYLTIKSIFLLLKARSQLRKETLCQIKKLRFDSINAVVDIDHQPPQRANSSNLEDEEKHIDEHINLFQSGNAIKSTINDTETEKTQSTITSRGPKKMLLGDTNYCFDHPITRIIICILISIDFYCYSWNI